MRWWHVEIETDKGALTTGDARDLRFTTAVGRCFVTASDDGRVRAIMEVDAATADAAITTAVAELVAAVHLAEPERMEDDLAAPIVIVALQSDIVHALPRSTSFLLDLFPFER